MNNLSNRTFKYKYRNVDVLIIDNSVSREQRDSRNSHFYLYDSNKQIIIN